MYSMSQQKTGDWWDGIALATVSIDSVPVDLTGASIVINFKLAGSSSVSLSKSVLLGGITLSNPTAGQFSVDGFVVGLSPGQYEVEIVVVAADGKPRTVFSADWTITARLEV